MNVQKEGIGNNMIVTQNIVQVSKNDFIDEDYQINQTISELIFINLHYNGYLTIDNYPSLIFDIDVQISFENSSFNIYSQKAYDVLRNKIFFLPSKVYI